MKVFPVLFLLAFGVVDGASNRTSSLLELTKQTLDLIPSLRKIARSEDGEKGTVVETTVKRISDIFANFRPRERLNNLNILRSAEGGENSGGLMRRIADTLDPVLNPLRNLTAHVAGNRTLSALFPKKN